MNIPIYQIDAFANRPFEGNPAAVCPLDQWLDDHVMQQIAAENNLSETAFFVPEGQGYHIRWFTPQSEIDLCGHATLASAFVLWNYLQNTADKLRFRCQVGAIQVMRQSDRLILDFPARPVQAIPVDPIVLDALGVPDHCVNMAIFGTKLLVELTDETRLRTMTPDFDALLKTRYQGFHVTARASKFDFVNRMFAPAVGIDEDPVTGSAFTMLGPYWSARLGKTTLTARQESRRGGNVFIELAGDRVHIGGHAVCVLRGELINIPS